MTRAAMYDYQKKRLKHLQKQQVVILKAIRKTRALLEHIKKTDLRGRPKSTGRPLVFK